MKWKCKHCDEWEKLPNVVNRPGRKVCEGPELNDVFIREAEDDACPVARITKYEVCPTCDTIILKVSDNDYICPNCGHTFCVM